MNPLYVNIKIVGIIILLCKTEKNLQKKYHRFVFFKSFDFCLWSTQLDFPIYFCTDFVAILHARQSLRTFRVMTVKKKITPTY